MPVNWRAWASISTEYDRRVDQRFCVAPTAVSRKQSAGRDTERVPRACCPDSPGAARGGRRGCALEPFTRLRLAWSGRGELHTLTGCEGGRAYDLMRSQLAFGLYCNELTLRLLPRDAPAVEVFVAYEELLAGLCGDGNAWAAVLRFELALLDLLGHPLVGAASHWADGIHVGDYFAYRFQEGFVRVPKPGPTVVSGETLKALAFESLLVGTALEECLRLSESLIDRIMGGRLLETRRLLPSTARSAL